MLERKISFVGVGVDYVLLMMRHIVLLHHCEVLVVWLWLGVGLAAILGASSSDDSMLTGTSIVYSSFSGPEASRCVGDFPEVRYPIEKCVSGQRFACIYNRTCYRSRTYRDLKCTESEVKVDIAQCCEYCSGASGVYSKVVDCRGAAPVTLSNCRDTDCTVGCTRVPLQLRSCLRMPGYSVSSELVSCSHVVHEVFSDRKCEKDLVSTTVIPAGVCIAGARWECPPPPPPPPHNNAATIEDL